MNLIEVSGSTPTKYALNVVEHFLENDFKLYVCTDNFKKPYNSNKIPISKEHYNFANLVWVPQIFKI